MIQTMMTARPDALLPVPSSRLPVADDLRWNILLPSSGCSSQQSQRSAPSDLLYTHDLRRALDKLDIQNRGTHLQKSRSRDHIDDRRDVDMTHRLRHGDDVDSNSAYLAPVNFRRESAWVASPPPRGHDESRAMTGNDLGGAMTSGYHGDADEEDDESVSPPKITPVSGRILTVIDHPIVKPIPFKPVPSSSCCSSSFDPLNRRLSSQNSSLDRGPGKTSSVHIDDGYVSREWQNLSSSSSVSQNSFPGSDPTDRKSGKSSSDLTGHRRPPNSEQHSGVVDSSRGGYDRRSSGSSCCRRRGISFTQTPSPSDSGVGELEAMLREKEMELQSMRETMERNEMAMMQVFEERKQNWEMELGDVVHEWQLKLRSHQQKSFRAEQSLLLQIFKLQQENKNLRHDLEMTAKEDQTGSYDDELRTKTEELVLERKQLTTEVEVLKSKLKSAVEEASGRSMELISTQLVLKDSEIEIDCKNSEIHRLLTDLNQLKRDLKDTNEQRLGLECRLRKLDSESSSPSSDCLALSESLKIELGVAQKDLVELRATLERERAQWSEEKTKVINYQKHLQLNYIQMARKNKLLEIEVQQMTSELERHDSECQRVTMDESFC